jgi:O-antigen ligase
VLVPQMGLPRFLGETTIMLCLGAWTVFLSPFLMGFYKTATNTETVMNAGRFLGFFTNPNMAGLAADMAAAACFACLTLPRKSNGLLIAAISLTGFGAVLTFSRGALLTLAGVGIGYLLLTAQLGKRGIGLMIAGVILLGVSFWFFTGGYHNFQWTPQQLRRIKSMEKIMTFQEVDDRDTGGRMIGTAAGLAYWQESPWMGHGLGSLHAMPDEYYGGVGCHNMHVTILGESGVLAGLPYFAFLAMWWIQSLMCRQQAVKALSLGFAFVYCFFGMVSHGILDQRSVNMLLGVIIGLLSLEQFLVSKPVVAMMSAGKMPAVTFRRPRM